MSPNHAEIIIVAATRLTKPHGGQRGWHLPKDICCKTIPGCCRM
jgi:hypothetical protein